MSEQSGDRTRSDGPTPEATTTDPSAPEPVAAPETREAPSPPDASSGTAGTGGPGDLPPSPADLPVDHDDREHVVGLLQDAVNRGLIDTLEFDRRSGLAITARTRRDLNSLVVDLPLDHPDRARARTEAESRERRRTPRDAWSGGDTSGTVALHATLGSVKRSGAWAVPRRMEIDGWLGSAELDLTQAVIDHDVVEIDVDMTLGSVELRLPETASASLEGVSATAGSIEDKRRNGSASGRPHVVVTGKVAFGSVEVKGPKWWR